VQSLEALQKIGRQVTSLLDLDKILAAVVEATVELTQAEEGSLLLIDDASGELYMRAAHNFQGECAQTFRLPTQNTLAGQVLHTGEPILIDDSTPQKIKTAYLVHALIYVPLFVKDRVIGVLGVDNRQAGQRFTEYHLALVSALGEYAAIAIENARLFAASERERSQFETLLTGVEDGVIVIDQEGRVLLINRTAREAFGISGGQDAGARPLGDIIQHVELLEMADEKRPTAPYRAELTLEDGRVMNTQFTPIPEVGLIVIMQDITHLKELDRIKSDFVSTVSHDLRSPLTAILGYVELLERVGPINDMQREFIRRVEISVQNITALISDLLDLGRIEAGFDSRKEMVPLSPLVRFSLEGLPIRAAEKSQDLIIEIPADLPSVLGNPVRLRQMIANLVGNALKYTQAGGKIWVRGHTKADQVILEIADNGPGIPAADQPYIFDKFFRASNTPESTPGTGLGLAIVKSIAENHQGRIWAESVPGQGTTFTIVLPVANHKT
jgi:two-component system NtrC family sensor kinase